VNIGSVVEANDLHLVPARVGGKPKLADTWFGILELISLPMLSASRIGQFLSFERRANRQPDPGWLGTSRRSSACSRGIRGRKIVGDLMFFSRATPCTGASVARWKGWKRERGADASFQNRTARAFACRVEARTQIAHGSTASCIVPKHIGLRLAICCPITNRRAGCDEQKLG